MALLKVSFVALAVVAAIVSADVSHLPRNSYLPPVTGGYNYEKPTTPSTRPPVTTTTHDHDHHEPGMPFDFYYEVKDNVGNDFNHNSVSDGDVVRGEYRVLLPDGRTQIVKYVADWKNGYNAVVEYEGTAVYPPPQPPQHTTKPPSTYVPPKNTYLPPKVGY